MTCPHPTQLWQTILPPNRCIGIWHGHHTLTRGWTPCSHLLKTQTTPNHILLHYLYTHQMELWYLWTRTPSNNESTYSLVALLGMDKNPIHYPHWPCQPPILEGPSETKPSHGMMACQPPRVWFHYQTHPWKDQHPSRQTIMPTQLWPRQKQQPRSNSPWTKDLCQHHPPIDTPWIIKKKPYDPHPWSPHSQTPRTGRNNQKSHGNTTMDQNVPMDIRLH